MIAFNLIEVTCLFMALDLATGFIGAVKNKCVDSRVMKNGLFHKCGFILAIVLACLCEYTIQFIDLGFQVPLQKAVCSFIILTEIVSNLENLGKITPELMDSKIWSMFNVSGEDIDNAESDDHTDSDIDM